MDRLVKAQDFTWAMAQVFIWSCCEPLVGIVCACLPTYGPLVRRWWRVAASTDDYNSGKNSFNPDNTNVRNNKARKEWKQLNGDDVKLRQDDEFELTNDISGGGARGSLRTKQSDDEFTGHNGTTIHVQNEFSWVGSARDEGSKGG